MAFDLVSESAAPKPRDPIDIAIERCELALQLKRLAKKLKPLHDEDRRLRDRLIQLEVEGGDSHTNAVQRINAMVARASLDSLPDRLPL
jgi:hypothetical protein